jgi:hypothetical protein
MESKAPSPPEQRAPTAPHKAYHKPRLQVYGDLSEITLGKLGSKSNDGSGHPNRHFTS